MVNEHDDRDESFWAPGTVALEDSTMNLTFLIDYFVLIDQHNSSPRNQPARSRAYTLS